MLGGNACFENETISWTPRRIFKLKETATPTFVNAAALPDSDALSGSRPGFSQNTLLRAAICAQFAVSRTRVHPSDMFRSRYSHPLGSCSPVAPTPDSDAASGSRLRIVSKPRFRAARISSPPNAPSAFGIVHDHAASSTANYSTTEKSETRGEKGLGRNLI